MYSEVRKVRFSECDREGRLSLLSLLNYFQDIAESGCGSSALNMDIIRKAGRFYAVASWEIAVERSPSEGETVTVLAYLNADKNRLAVMSFELRNENGDVLCAAVCNMVLCSTETGRAAAKTSEMRRDSELDAYSALQVTRPERRSGKENFCHSRYVCASDSMTDLNGHVNNAKYVHLIGDEVPPVSHLSKVYMHYHKPVFPREKLDVTVCENKGRRTIRILSADTGDLIFTADIVFKLN